MTLSTFKPAVVTVGDELVYGERSNANQSWLLKTLWQRGIPANMALSLPDKVEEIALWIRQLKQSEHHPILVSGGIGGTHDDCTRKGIAKGLGVSLAKNKACLKLLEKLTERYNAELTDQVSRMAMLPEGCKLIANPIGAPGFTLDGVYAFPGFPTMLEPMATAVLDKIAPVDSKAWLTEEIVLPVSEGAVSQAVETFSEQYPAAHVGLYPSSEKFRHEVTIRFRGPGDRPELADSFKQLVADLRNSLELS